MSNDGADFEGEEEFAAERPFGGRPFGGRPFGGRPFGGRPFGGRPFGGRPFGGRPFGGRPFGGRPFGGRPFGGREGGQEGGGFPDPDELSADVAELVCENSAAVLMGTTLVLGTDELQIPDSAPVAGFRAPGAAGPAPGPTQQVPLRPGDWRLEASVAVPAGFIVNPEIISPLKVDLAEALALELDRAVLGAAPGGPPGIANLLGITGPANGGGQRLQRLRQIVSSVRAAHPLHSAGWILHPQSLDDIARFLTRNGVTQAAQGRTVDTSRLLRYDETGGGTLLGLPFVTSLAAVDPQNQNRRRVYFSGDWAEAWIGVDPSFVTVGVSGAPPAAAAPPGQVLITASMRLGFTLRRAGLFRWSVS